MSQDLRSHTFINLKLWALCLSRCHQTRLPSLVLRVLRTLGFPVYMCTRTFVFSTKPSPFGVEVGCVSSCHPGAAACCRGLWSVVRTCPMVVNLSVLEHCPESWADQEAVLQVVSRPSQRATFGETWPGSCLQLRMWNGQGRAFSLPGGSAEWYQLD